MARVPLTPIGSPREAIADDASFAAARDALREKEALLLDRREKVRAGWGPKYVARVHEIAGVDFSNFRPDRNAAAGGALPKVAGTTR